MRPRRRRARFRRDGDVDFLPAVKTNFLAIAQIFVLGCFGFYVLRRGILGECCLRTLSDLALDVTLPCFIFTNIIESFHTIRAGSWYLYPLYCAGMFALAAAISGLYILLDRNMRARGETVALVTFQNSGFLPIIIVGTLLPAAVAGRMYVYIFLFVLLFSPVLFIMSESLFSSRGNRKLSARNLANPVALATVAALLIAIPGRGDLVPQFIFHPLKMVGVATIPLSMIVIGGMVMVNFSRSVKYDLAYIIKVGALKLVALPLAVYGIISMFHAPPELRFLLLMEAMMPPAVSLPMLARKYHGDHELVGQALFGVTLLSLVTVPVLLSALRAVPLR